MISDGARQAFPLPAPVLGSARPPRLATRRGWLRALRSLKASTDGEVHFLRNLNCWIKPKWQWILYPIQGLRHEKQR